VVAVPLFQSVGLGSVLGYLAAGAALGPYGLSVIGDSEGMVQVSQFGVVLLLFVIGLELKPQRLWVMRRQVFGLGGAQVAVTGAALGFVAAALGLAPEAAGIAGFGLALSSTAFVLPLLAARDELGTVHGRASFAVLLFQDLAVIPALALLPLMAGSSADPLAMAIGGAKALGLLVAVLVGGRYLLRPVLRLVAQAEIREIFVAASLLVVVGTAALMEIVGLSMTLGAFLAGVLLADSEYRHEVQADIEPFKGLLLGLFFMAVGMTTDFRLLASKPLTVAAVVVGLMTLKAVVMFGISFLARLGGDASRRTAVTVSQGGEFAFVLFGLAVAAGLMDRAMSDLLVVAVTISMVATPAAMAVYDKLIAPLFSGEAARPFDDIDEPGNPVIIAGFGRFGQVVGRVLRSRGIPFTAIEASVAQVDFVARFGSRVYYGDASRLDLLRAAEAEKARAFVLAIDDPEASVRTAEMVRRHFPNLPIFARARNRQHAFRLMDLRVNLLVRETFHSSLFLTEHLLEALGLSSEDAKSTVSRFRDYDERLLESQHAIYEDEAKLIQTARDAAEELRLIFEHDHLAAESAEEAAEAAADPPGDGAPSAPANAAGESLDVAVEELVEEVSGESKNLAKRERSES
jgi:glutathione-regulated potassium-efflux system ancillary protein KefC/glutathione-regulated potassium-efflux system protein KefB